MANNSLSDEQRRSLLDELSGLPIDADLDDDVIRTFLPNPVYERALDQRILVVRGERGAGKTALFNLMRAAGHKNIPLSEIIPNAPAGRRIDGYLERGLDHPPADVVESYASTATPEALRAFWLGHLVGRLRAELPATPTLAKSFVTAYEHMTAPSVWVPVVQTHLAEVYAWLDTIEQTARTTCFVIYDHLDRIAANQSDVRRKLANALLGLWMSLSQRYERLRGKILLREDLFQSAITSFADATKLVARSVRIDWQSGGLYALLVRRMATFEGLREWLKERTKIPLSRRPHLGAVPPAELDDYEQRRFATALVGQYMGAGPTKGRSDRWLINHLQDATLRVTPRSFLELVRSAAESALQQGPKAGYLRLLAPIELQNSLEKASKRRVDELLEDYPVMASLEGLRGRTLFLPRKEVLSAIRVVGRDSLSVFAELVSLGVLADRGGDRIDIPDVIRFAFGIKRKGGVRQVA